MNGWNDDSNSLFSWSLSSEAVSVGGDEALVCFMRQKEGPPSQLPQELADIIRSLQDNQVFTAGVGEVELLPSLGRSPYSYIIVAGLGPDGSIQDWREAAGAAAEKALGRGISRLTASVDSDKAGDERLALIRALTEGFVLGSYTRKSYKKQASARTRLEHVRYLLAGDLSEESLREVVRTAYVYAAATNYARDLTNLPGNELVPETMASEAMRLAAEYGLECIVHDERELLELGMHALYNVGKGSLYPPRMIVLKYQGLPEWNNSLGLVGKGITFDTGGISLKKAEGMEEMISDMGGAAVLLGVMKAIGELKPQVNLLAVIPSAENMPSGGALKPGDIIPTLSGKTIEVINTDAEGRIVLADGVTYAKQLGAERIIDVATLTGAVLVSLGDVATGAVTNDDAFLKELLQAAERSGEKLWPLPAYPEFREMLESTVADIKNAASNRWAGASTGGLFIGEFAEKTPWIHLDTGGTAWLEKKRGLDPQGGTGAMVRTLLHYILH
ncbi:leucyl aminopeptidase [Paenibacillus sp. J2TS4]|uniref:leucyl aminopeptidase n=1 Tax=Paenibacillus sp. J2TS4 TaxID=2807194 RepID=UPI001B14DE0A|nr:leucyl aminopeptidase [Paenibacillus sp. J2TS4]GIP34431.1 hypothetical protein J2TS4_36410 [Paenibacillus sp. J2TS4]